MQYPFICFTASTDVCDLLIQGRVPYGIVHYIAYYIERVSVAPFFVPF